MCKDFFLSILNIYSGIHNGTNGAKETGITKYDKRISKERTKISELQKKVSQLYIMLIPFQSVPAITNGTIIQIKNYYPQHSSIKKVEEFYEHKCKKYNTMPAKNGNTIFTFLYDDPSMPCLFHLLTHMYQKICCKETSLCLNQNCFELLFITLDSNVFSFNFQNVTCTIFLLSYSTYMQFCR